MQMRYKSTSITKAEPRDVSPIEDESSRLIRGYASAFGVVDSYDEIILKGAFDETLANEGHAARRKVLWNHLGGAWISERPIGIPTALEVDDYGLYYETLAAPTPLGDEVLALYRAKIITENSIGFIMRWADVETVVGPEGDYVLGIKRVAELREVSPVVWGSNPGAIMLSAGGRPAWLALRDELDGALRKVKGVLGSKAIISRQLASQRKAFDRLEKSPGCNNCGACGKGCRDTIDLGASIDEAGKILEQIKSLRS
jgi:HK97 family phage prohead protease